jgi:3-oxoadipate enol-lactonase
MTPGLHVVTVGNDSGRPLLFIHGSAADHTTWMMQLGGTLKQHFGMVAYDRRGYGKSAGAPDAGVQDHADDALSVAREYCSAQKPVVIGSSFGAVVALDLARRFGPEIAGLVLIEPPMAASDHVPLIPAEFLQQFDHLERAAGGVAAGEFFLRTVLGDAAFERMPKMFSQRSAAMYAGIRADSAALGRYQPHYGQLRSMQVPTLLLGGERSATYFQATLDALQSHLPTVQRVLVPGAGHMLHAEASRKFAELLIAFEAGLA